MRPPSFPPELSRRDALARLVAAFEAAGLDEAGVDARILVEDATGLRALALAADGQRPLGAEASARLEDWAARRLAREPVFRILGQRQFWGLDLAVTPAVLDPRPDTETLVMAALAAVAPRRREALAVLDLGTGSGAILCALLTELPAARGLGIDRSPDACAVAARNLASCGVAGRCGLREGDWAAGLDGRFDLVVSNPPYIETDAIPGLAPEVRDHDPRLALDGGADGLDAYRAIATALPRLLVPGGVAALEVGAGQADAVAVLLASAGLTLRAPTRDLGGVERAVVGVASP